MARTTNDRDAARERAQEKVTAALALLEEGIGAIVDSESFARYLRCLGRFHSYSTGNVMLILLQRPDATRVAGYKAWQALGRQVRKGEKGIGILVPYVGRVATGDEGAAQKSRKSQNSAGEPAQNAQNAQNPAASGRGEEQPGETTRVATRFGIGHVFDIAQTEGEPLPEPPPVRPLTDSTEQGRALWDALRAWLAAEGVAVVVEDCGGPNGYYAPARRTIAVHKRLIGTDHATKTLAHEAAHYAAAHHGGLDRRDAETVAEGAAFVVLHHHSLDTSGYTFPYVAGWAEDRAVLRRNIDRIGRLAAHLIAAIDESAVAEAA